MKKSWHFFFFFRSYMWTVYSFVKKMSCNIMEKVCFKMGRTEWYLFFSMFVSVVGLWCLFVILFPRNIQTNNRATSGSQNSLLKIVNICTNLTFWRQWVTRDICERQSDHKGGRWEWSWGRMSSEEWKRVGKWFPSTFLIEIVICRGFKLDEF